jgi:DNA-binding transcriptional LysR family regulator
MSKAIDWDSRIGRRVRLRDLHILFAAVQHGSMAKAGAHLNMSQSAVSQAIAAIEHTLSVRLLDRTSRGVEPTIYGSALLRRGQAAFDELRIGVKEIESLADPGAGEVRIACGEVLSAGVLPHIIEHMLQRYPCIRFEMTELSSVADYSQLVERKVDVRLSLLVKPMEREIAKDFDTEILYHDHICLAVGAQSPWVRRRKIDLAELVGEKFVMPPFDAQGPSAIRAAFEARSLPPPSLAVTTYSVHLRNLLGMSGRFIVALPASSLALYADIFALKRLPVTLPASDLPVAVVTLKNRTLSPTVELFLECAREVTRSLAVGPEAVKRAGLAGKRVHQHVLPSSHPRPPLARVGAS